MKLKRPVGTRMQIEEKQEEVCRTVIRLFFLQIFLSAAPSVLTLLHLTDCIALSPVFPLLLVLSLSSFSRRPAFSLRSFSTSFLCQSPSSPSNCVNNRLLYWQRLAGRRLQNILYSFVFPVVVVVVISVRCPSRLSLFFRLRVGEASFSSSSSSIPE